MADTTSQPIRFSATVKDETGTKVATPAYAIIDPALTVTQLLSNFATWALALDAVTDGQIIEGRMEVAVDLTTTAYTGATPPLKTAPVEAARVNQTGVINFSPAAVLRRWGLLVPAIADAVLDTGDRINLAAAAVTTLTTLMKNPSSITTFAYTNPYVQDLKNLVDAVTSFRGLRRQLQRSSSESA